MEISTFADWLDKHKLTPWEFSKLSHIHVDTIKKAKRGEFVRKDTAKKIIRYSKKELRLEDFGFVTKQKTLIQNNTEST